MKMKQIAIAPYRTQGRLTSSVYALGVDGSVYMYRHTLGGWVRLPTREVVPDRHYVVHAEPEDQFNDDLPF